MIRHVSFEALEAIAAQFQEGGLYLVTTPGSEGIYLVAGSEIFFVKTQLVAFEVKTITNSYVVQPGDYTILCDGALTVTLPDAVASRRRELNIKNIGSGTVTVDGAGAVIDQELSQTIIPGNSMDIQSDGTFWSIL